MGIQGYTKVYNVILAYRRIYQGLQGYTRVYKGKIGFTKVYMSIQGYTMDKDMLGFTRI